MSWTDERVETLKKMWSDGQSASQIAKELGGVTRNAVIGKVHRLGLSNRAGGPVDAPLTAGAPLLRAAGDEVGAEDEDFDLDEAEEEVPPAVVPLRAVPDPGPDAKVEAVKAEAKPDAKTGERPAAAPVLSVALRKPIISAGQPLPPQPSANEISPEALASVREVEKKAKKLTLMELTERTCKWPIGDPATPDFWFCGLATQAGKPYCEAHVGVAFQPMSSRRDRRR